MKEYIWIDGKELLTTNRLDLMAKYAYVESIATGHGTSWAQELYCNHIEAFSGGSFREPGNEEKTSLKNYIDTFNKLILDISTGGIDPGISTIPVSKDKRILDGAHRVAIAAYYDLKVPCSVKDESSIYNYAFFHKMHLDPKYIDAMATKYVEVHGQKCYVICLWPKACRDASKLQFADSLIMTRANGRILCSKDIKITYKGLRNLMIQAYIQHEWVGNAENNFKGVQGKVDPCYDSCEKIRTYIVEMDNVSEILALKKEIRDCFGVGNDSIHSSDNYGETLLLTHLLYNQNSLKLLNYGQIDYDGAFVRKVCQFNAEIKNKGLDTGKFIIDSSGVLGLYGIRKVADLDYLTTENNVDFDALGYDNHKSYASFYNTEIGELIQNPLLHCYAFGMKFITIEMLKIFKRSRAGKKDLDDIKLIDLKIKQAKSLRLSIDCKVIQMKRKCRNIKTKIRELLEDRNILFFTKVWHFLRGKGFQ